jgi:purine-nucleoside phosphorylase
MTKCSPEPWCHALAVIKQHTPFPQPDLAVILGSGLGSVADSCNLHTRISYSDIPGLPQPTVDGHAGELIIGEVEGWNILFFSGRYHLYEGYTAAEVVAPVELAAAAGASRLLLTNAAGGINPDFPVHSFMCIADQLNLTGDNPLKGVHKNPFIDLTHIYNLDLYSALIKQQNIHGVILNRGVLASVPGPSYETPAEVRALQILGADAVSMSTVPEAIMARYLKMDIAGLSFISNAAAGCSSSQLDHDDVLSSGCLGANQLSQLLPVLVKSWQSI